MIKKKEWNHQIEVSLIQCGFSYVFLLLCG